MAKKRILILGAGISGLSLAYFLSKTNQFDITIFEKENRCGGCSQTDTSTGFLFEKGPRTFVVSRCPDLLELAKELKIEPVFSDFPKRYLWRDGRLKKMTQWPLVAAMWKEWRVPVSHEDETVWDFACRRFNRNVAELFFEPMATGIFAGDARKLSIRACFPAFKRWEEQYGSVTKGFFRHHTKHKLFTFPKGISSIVKQLEQVPAEFRFGEEVKSIHLADNEVEVNGIKGDYLVCALPCQIAGKLFDFSIPANGTTVVNLGYDKQVLSNKGYGYLVAAKENDEVMGVTFDSNISPSETTRITVMLRRTDVEDPIKVAIEALRRHLNLTVQPNAAMSTCYKSVFPQFEIGHEKRIRALEEKLHPRVKLVGNYFYGAGVNDCVARAKSAAVNLLRTVAS